jgi:PDZ domain
LVYDARHRTHLGGILAFRLGSLARREPALQLARTDAEQIGELPLRDLRTLGKPLHNLFWATVVAGRFALRDGRQRLADALQGDAHARVLSGSPADKAGLVTGDVITGLGGRTVASPTALIKLLIRTSPGDTLRLRWSDQRGITHTGTIRPVGPPQ